MLINSAVNTYKRKGLPILAAIPPRCSGLNARRHQPPHPHSEIDCGIPEFTSRTISCKSIGGPGHHHLVLQPGPFEETNKIKDL